MPDAQPPRLDTVIIGGGIAALWLLDELRRLGHRVVLIERKALGSGQTIGAQGIIHGGLKYTLAGMLTGSAEQIREMPELWRACLAGRREPDLSAVPIRAPFCYLWRTSALSGRFGMVGARAGLRVAPQTLPPEAWPPLLAGVPGGVLKLDEQVLGCGGLVSVLADRNAGRLIRGDVSGFRAETRDTIQVEVRLDDHRTLTLHTGHLVLAAGGGNAALRQMAGLEPGMQRRPLHMSMVRGPADHPLPVLNGHCVDGKKTRVTITTDHDLEGRPVWTVGGQVSEEGVERDEARQDEVVRRELEHVLPGLRPGGVCAGLLASAEFGSWRVDRAEPQTRGGLRPEDAWARAEGGAWGGRLITAWPTKLALAPRLAEQVVAMVGPSATPDQQAAAQATSAAIESVPAPEVAPHFWDVAGGVVWRR